MTHSAKLARFRWVGPTRGVFGVVRIAMSAVLLLAAAACDSSIRVSGTVRDPQGTAVTLEPESGVRPQREPQP